MHRREDEVTVLLVVPLGLVLILVRVQRVDCKSVAASPNHSAPNFVFDLNFTNGFASFNTYFVGLNAGNSIMQHHREVDTAVCNTTPKMRLWKFG